MGTLSLSVLHSTFLTLTGVALGRLVTNVKNPSQDFWPENAAPLPQNEFDERPFNQLQNFLGKTIHVGLRAKATHLLYGGVASQTSSSGELVAPESKVYSLLQPSSHFQRMCKDNATREWMERTLKRCPIFLVVGLITVTQATVSQGRHEARQVSSSVAVPVTDIVTYGASTVLLPANIGASLNVGLDTSAGHETHAVSSFIAPGERVIGVQYRKIKFRLFSSNKAETSFLENNPHRWVMLFGGDKSGSDNILEADFEDTISVDDLELEEAEVITDDEQKIVLIDE